MSYYEKRIAELEARVAQLAREQRIKAIPVEAQLIDRIAELKAENERLRKAGDALVGEGETMAHEVSWVPYTWDNLVCDWNDAKEGKPSL